MAPKSLAEQMAELEDLTPRGNLLILILLMVIFDVVVGGNYVLTMVMFFLDYDPEDLDRGNQDSDEEGAAGGEDENAGREHYQAVG